MQTSAEVFEQVKRLSLRERRELIIKIVESLDEEPASREAAPFDESEGNPYALTIALAGTVHTDYPDVSSNKKKHLGDIYFSKKVGKE